MEVLTLPEGDILLKPCAEGSEIQLVMLAEVSLGLHTEHWLVHPAEGMTPAHSVAIEPQADYELIAIAALPVGTLLLCNAHALRGIEAEYEDMQLVAETKPGIEQFILSMYLLWELAPKNALLIVVLHRRIVEEPQLPGTFGRNFLELEDRVGVSHLVLVFMLLCEGEETAAEVGTEQGILFGGIAAENILEGVGLAKTHASHDIGTSEV